MWMEEILNSVSLDDKATELFQNLVVNPSARPNYQVVHGILGARVVSILEMIRNYSTIFFSIP